MEAQHRIIRDYLYAMPLAAVAGYGEVTGTDGVREPEITSDELKTIVSSRAPNLFDIPEKFGNRNGVVNLVSSIKSLQRSLVLVSRLARNHKSSTDIESILAEMRVSGREILNDSPGCKIFHWKIASV